MPTSWKRLKVSISWGTEVRFDGNQWLTSQSSKSSKGNHRQLFRSFELISLVYLVHQLDDCPHLTIPTHTWTQLSVVRFDDLDDWEVNHCLPSNRTLVPQLIETISLYQLVGINTVYVFLSILGLAQVYMHNNLPLTYLCVCVSAYCIKYGLTDCVITGSHRSACHCEGCREFCLHPLQPANTDHHQKTQPQWSPWCESAELYPEFHVRAHSRVWL